MQRDKVSLDIFWLKDENLEDSENLPAPDVIAAEIVENLESALEQFSGIYEGLGKDKFPVRNFLKVHSLRIKSALLGGRKF